MSDNKKRIKLQRYQWPDEILAKKKARRKKIINTLLVMILLVVAIFGGYFLGTFTTSRLVSNGSNNTSKLSLVLDMMENEWYFADEVDNVEETLLDQALLGMTTFEVDPHTSYMTSQEIEDFFANIDNDFVGIGVRVRNYDTYLVVDSVFKNSPAEESGLVAGDIIFSVDGELVSDHEYEDVVNMIKGEANTKVSLGIMRDDERISIDVIRQQVNTTVDGQMLDENIAYVELSSFGELTCDQLITYLDEFEQQGVNKLLLDLRNDGGGHLGSVVDIGGLFIDKDEVILEQEAADGTILQYVSEGKRHYDYDEIVVLVNESTASAAEVLTLALKQQVDNVTIVGTTTYGKGTIQTTVYLSDGSALKYTTSKWNAPDGTNINNVGIVPDVIVEIPEIISSPYYDMEDGVTIAYDSVNIITIQLQKALIYLGYNVDREDGYFDLSTENALKAFESDNGLNVDGILDKNDNEKIFMAISEKWALDESDVQKNAALDILLEE